MNVFTSIPFIIILVFFVAILILFGILLITPTLYTNYGLIKEFPDSKQKFIEEESYKVTDRKLTNNERDNVIFPNDELTYSFKVDNLKNFTTVLDYQIEFFQGGVLEEPAYSNHGRLNPLSEEIQVTKKIYLKSSGTYDIKLNLFFENSTNEKYAQYAPTVDSIEVLSRSEQLLSQQNENISNGVKVSLGIGSLTVAALVGSLLYSRREVNLLTKKTEKEEKRIMLIKIFEMLSSSVQKENRKKMFNAYNIAHSRDDEETIHLFIPQGILKDTANRVLESFNQTAIFVENDLVDKKLFLKIYVNMIIRVWDALEEYVGTHNKDFASHFKDLYIIAKKYIQENNLEYPKIYKDSDFDPYAAILDNEPAPKKSIEE